MTDPSLSELMARLAHLARECAEAKRKYEHTRLELRATATALVAAGEATPLRDRISHDRILEALDEEVG